MLKQQLQQKLQQRLSPQQIMLAKLLEASTPEVENIIKQNLEDNPALEESVEKETTYSQTDYEEGHEGTNSESAEEMIRADYFSDDDIPDYRLQTHNYSRDQERESFVFTDASTLLENLNEQLHNRVLTDKQYKIGEYILGSIDADGYLRRTLAQISDDLIFSQGIDASQQEIEEVLEIIHEFDPIGIGARDLRECLLIQIEHAHYTPAREKAFQILDQCFEEFSTQRYDKIYEKLALSQEELEEAIQIIIRLNPKPANGLPEDANDKAMQIVPDFEIETDNDGEPIVTLINSHIPELKISHSYAEMVKDYNANAQNRSTETRATINYIKQKLDAASSFISAIKQRQETLLRIMTAIAHIQRDFFSEGTYESLKPLRLKDISQLTGYDISTISRVTNQKYAQTAFGLFQLKYFFKEVLTNDHGEEITVEEIESLIQKAISEEDPNEPFTDDQLSSYLKQHGYSMARRTVAKYRQQMNIAQAKTRKANYQQQTTAES